MMIEGEGRFAYPRRGKTGVIYIPADITRDSQFPLKEGRVKVRIEGDKVIIHGIDFTG